MKIFACCCWSVVLANWAFSRDFADYSDDEKGRLGKGEIMVWEKGEAAGKRFVEAAVLLDEPVQKVWKLIDSKEEIPRVMESVISAKVLSREGDVTTIAQEVKGLMEGMTAKYVVKHVGRYPFRVDFERISGDFRSVEGCWLFEEVDGADGAPKTLLSYRLHLDAGRFVPQNLVIRAQLKKLPKVMTAIRERLKRFPE